MNQAMKAAMVYFKWPEGKRWKAGMVRTMLSWPRRIKDSIEQEGLRHLLLRGALWPVYRAEHLVARPLDAYQDEVIPGIAVSILSESALTAVTALYPRSDSESLRSRLHRGDTCFAASVDGVMAGCRCTSIDEAPLDSLGLVLPLLAREMCSYAAYVRPAARGRGVARALRRAYQEYYALRGYSVLIGSATPGRGPWGKAFPYHVATIRTLRLGPVRKFWARTYGPEANYWRERLKELRWA